MTVQSNTRNQLEVTEYANNNIVERLQTIPGVSTITIWGEKKYAMRIWFDPQKLSAYNLTAFGCTKCIAKRKCGIARRKN